MHAPADQEAPSGDSCPDMDASAKRVRPELPNGRIDRSARASRVRFGPDGTPVNPTDRKREGRTITPAEKNPSGRRPAGPPEPSPRAKALDPAAREKR
jgi:hypothetical protein